MFLRVRSLGDKSTRNVFEAQYLPTVVPTSAVVSEISGPETLSEDVGRPLCRQGRCDLQPQRHPDAAPLPDRRDDAGHYSGGLGEKVSRERGGRKGSVCAAHDKAQQQ